MPHRIEGVYRGDCANCGAEDQRLSRMVVSRSDGLKQLLMVCAFCYIQLQCRRSGSPKRA
jgi:hypothetical protein